ncbi:MAG: DMT family transporter [Clostridiales bacterium]|nr:DMT family transporter [Clostridiales bacterium]
MKAKHIATIYAIAAAALYAINVPFSKLLLNSVQPTMMAAFLYLGAGLGLFAYGAISKATGKAAQTEPLTKKELPYTIAMVILDIIAPILLMLGIQSSNAANVSLINNFEIVATSIIALVIFKEVISRRLWIAIGLVIAASVLLTFEGAGSFDFNVGSLFVFGACVCWGFENNCTKMISHKSSVEIVVIKGIFSGLGSLIVALVIGESLPSVLYVLCTLLLGFVSYGLSIHFYIMGQRDLGAAKTSAYYSIAPFLGVAFGMLILGERPGIQFYAALIVMIISTYFMIKDTVELQHTHEHTHTHSHEHRHGDIVHAHEHAHTHTHLHIHAENNDSHDHTHKQPLQIHTHAHSA